MSYRLTHREHGQTTERGGCGESRDEDYGGSSLSSQLSGGRGNVAFYDGR
jgi:prepilin-type processing-associated H-X9-DG protein